MEESNIENEEGYIHSRDRSRGTNLILDRNTYITPSKKFKFTRSEIFFNIFRSIIFGIVFAIFGIVLFNEDASLRVIGYGMLFIFLTSSIVVFILGIIAKRGMQIFSISLGGIFIAIILFFWAIIPVQKSTCKKLDGSFIREHEMRYSDDFSPPDYTCFISEEVMQQVSENEFFPYIFMTFEVAK